MLVAQVAYYDLVQRAEANGQELTQPWKQVRLAMAADPRIRHLVPFLPDRLDLAVRRHRKPRLIVGRPLARIAGRTPVEIPP